MDSVKPNSFQASRGRERKGQALVEFALVLPLLLLIVFGVLDLGRAFYVSVVLANAAREGARYASRHPDYTAEIIRQAALTETINSGVNLTTANVTLIPYPPVIGQEIRVRVEFELETVIGGILSEDWRFLPIRREAAMFVEP